ncbi:Sugar phosphate transporter domain [Sesbania bispinosa]|nr:Sugar phosphate transporter domain [Sesbania bispinosa]
MSLKASVFIGESDASVLLVMFNKAALSSYNFPSANVITLLQVLEGSFFTAGEAVIIADNSKKFVPLKTLKHTFPLAGAYLLYMLVTMESVRGVNVPMYTTLRRTTVVFTMLVEYMLVGQRYTPPVIFSVGLIVFGAFVAGARDLSFDAYGYAIVFLSNITTAIYLATISRVGCIHILFFSLSIKHTHTQRKFYTFSFIINLQFLIYLVLWSFSQAKLAGLIALVLCGAMVVMLFSCIIAFFLNYSIFLNTTLNSALTQTICGNMKDLFTIGFGWIIFGGLPFDFWNVIGQLLGFAGSGLYAYYKLIGK